MIHNRTDFYFSDVQKWNEDSFSRLLAVVDAWLACSVKVHREGTELILALSRCRPFCNAYVTKVTERIYAYLRPIMKHNIELERSFHRNPKNPQPGPVLAYAFHSPALDEDGCSIEDSVACTAMSVQQLAAEHYRQMYLFLSADPRANHDDINRARECMMEYACMPQESQSL